MPRFAANLSTMYTEYPLLERFARAAADGFRGVEFLYPYGEDIAAIARTVAANDLEYVLFNHLPGDFAAGQRGFANDPRRIGEFQEGVYRTIEIAQELGVTRLNCMAGFTLEDVPLRDQWEALADNLEFAAEETGRAGIQQMVEPINSIDMPGFMLNTPHKGFALVADIGHPNLWVQFDIFHAQRMEGNITPTLRSHIGQIGHIQIADSPDRHEPGTGEINYPFLFDVIDRTGYQGWVACEYNPSGRTEDSLEWFRKLDEQGFGQ